MKIHSFESMAAVDGEGIRVAVFFTGCPLRCVYCHNPDTWNGIGKEISTEDLVKKISRYKTYFGDKGGVTFSGGEPLLHAREINELYEGLEKLNINYALDTSGCVELNEDVKKSVENASMIILDLKMWDDESYEKYTGVSFKLIREFLKYAIMEKKRIWIRTVIVPGINDSTQILGKYIKNLKDVIGDGKITDYIEKYQLLGFHTMGFFKYEELGIDNPLKDTKDLDVSKLKELQEYIDECISNC